MKNRFRLLFAFTLLALTSLACNISQVSKIFGEYPHKLWGFTVSGWFF